MRKAEDVGKGKPTREFEAGEVLGTVLSRRALSEVEKIRAPVDGVICA